MLETQFLFETQWFVTLFCTENQGGGVHDRFCYGQHVRNLISVQKWTMQRAFLFENRGCVQDENHV